jgi:hypothetical protein
MQNAEYTSTLILPGYCFRRKCGVNHDCYTGLLAAINEAPEQFGFPPTIDGQSGLYPDMPSRLLSEGHFARLPFIAGTNLDEGQYSFSAFDSFHMLIVMQEPFLRPELLPRNKLLETR